MQSNVSEVVQRPPFSHESFEKSNKDREELKMAKKAHKKFGKKVK
tara:strand:+ start:1545 stop:1679 length:135 start_codon:yes stop_codon:yes gene_type:complete